MIIDFDGLTIIIFALIFIIVSVFIKKIKNPPVTYFILLLVMFIYLANVARLTIFPIYINCHFEENLYDNINIVPFSRLVVRDVFMNILMAIPMGIGLPFICRKMKNYIRMAVFGVAFGVLIEGLQFLGAVISNNFTVRYIDINDAFFNFCGVLLGYFLLRIFAGIFVKADRTKMINFWKYVYDICSLNSNTGVKEYDKK